MADQAAAWAAVQPPFERSTNRSAWQQPQQLAAAFVTGGADDHPRRDRQALGACTHDQRMHAMAYQQQQQQRHHAPLYTPLPAQMAAYYSMMPKQHQHYQAAAPTFSYHQPDAASNGSHAYLPQLGQQQLAMMPYYAPPPLSNHAVPGGSGGHLPPLGS